MTQPIEENRKGKAIPGKSWYNKCPMCLRIFTERRPLTRIPTTELLFELAIRGAINTSLGCPHCGRSIDIEPPLVLISVQEGDKPNADRTPNQNTR